MSYRILKQGPESISITQMPICCSTGLMKHCVSYWKQASDTSLLYQVLKCVINVISSISRTVGSITGKITFADSVLQHYNAWFQLNYQSHTATQLGLLINPNIRLYIEIVLSLWWELDSAMVRNFLWCGPWCGQCLFKGNLKIYSSVI